MRAESTLRRKHDAIMSESASAAVTVIDKLALHGPSAPKNMQGPSALWDSQPYLPDSLDPLHLLPGVSSHQHLDDSDTQAPYISLGATVSAALPHDLRAHLRCHPVRGACREA